ncbi:MAG TPA: methylmalonyl-CoA mutase family protein, partial [Pyrinomonadaceae bacterium]|nr:methylmalonyl-CoA mutase family protein [Pyrinomonadaceae bacterium]
MQEIKEASPEQLATERWEEEILTPALKRAERRTSFQTVSLEEVNRLYSPSDVSDINFEDDIAFPGQFPYTRGIHATGYRGKLWTMRQFAGFGTPEETNQR